MWKLNTPWAVGAALFFLGFSLGYVSHPHETAKQVIVVRYPETLAQWYLMRADDEWIP